MHAQNRQMTIAFFLNGFYQDRARGIEERDPQPEAVEVALYLLREQLEDWSTSDEEKEIEIGECYEEAVMIDRSIVAKPWEHDPSWADRQLRLSGGLAKIEELAHEYDLSKWDTEQVRRVHARALAKGGA